MVDLPRGDVQVKWKHLCRKDWKTRPLLTNVANILALNSQKIVMLLKMKDDAESTPF